MDRSKKNIAIFDIKKTLELSIMKIAFDAKRAAQNRTGLGNYSRFILHCISMYGKKENQYILYIPNLKKASLLNGFINHPSFFIRSPHFLWKKFNYLPV